MPVEIRNRRKNILEDWIAIAENQRCSSNINRQVFTCVAGICDPLEEIPEYFSDWAGLLQRYTNCSCTHVWVYYTRKRGGGRVMQKLLQDLYLAGTDSMKIMLNFKKGYVIN